MRPREEARRILSEFGVCEAPVPVEELVSPLGAQLSLKPLEGDISGMLYRDGERTILGVNSADSHVRQRFTIAHELGHLVLHKGRPIIVEKLVRINLRSTSSLASVSEEREANSFAAELLMPAELVREAAQALVGNRALLSAEQFVSQMAQRFDVSKQAMEYRLVNLRLLSPMALASE